MSFPTVAEYVAALRSGDYPYARGCLRDETGYCALTASEEGGRENCGSVGLCSTLRRLQADLSGGLTLPPMGMVEALDIRREVKELAWQNDAKRSFDQLADTITRHYEHMRLPPLAEVR